jgi:hypothetical protein
MSFPAICPIANVYEWLPPANIGGPMTSSRGLVLHVNAGNGDPYGWWTQPTTPTASSHFQLMKSGQLIQYVRLDTVAWCQVAGSSMWHSIETEGFPDEPLTDSAVSKLAALYAWGHNACGWPLQLADTPGDVGFGWHGMGGEGWGGHFGCVPVDDTEVLTPRGWVTLRQVTLESEVASYAPDSGIITFDRPLGIVPIHRDDTVSVAGIEMTSDHRLYVHRNDVPNSKVLTAAEVGKVRTNWSIPSCGTIGAAGVPISDDLLRLLVWTQADGHYAKKSGRLDHLDFHLSKSRKVDRICAVLDGLGKDYRCSLHSDGTTRIKVYGLDWLEENVLEWLPVKQWGSWLTEMSAAQFAVFDAEITKADGTEAKSQRQRFYFTKVKANADAVQALYVTHGRAASIYQTETQYVVNLHARSSGWTTRDTYGAARDGVDVGCLTTVNDTMLIRQAGRVAVVGNCPGDARKAQRSQILQLANSTPTTDWSDMASKDEIKAALREVLDEGTANGQVNWARTSKAILGQEQTNFNALKAISDAVRQVYANTKKV